MMYSLLMAGLIIIFGAVPASSQTTSTVIEQLGAALQGTKTQSGRTLPGIGDKNRSGIIYLGASSYGAGHQLHGDNIHDDFPYFQGVLQSLANKKPVSIIVPEGTYRIDHDIIFPSHIYLIFLKGAILAPSSVKGKSLASNHDNPAQGTIVCQAGSSIITGSGTAFRENLRAGQYITPASGPCQGVRRQVKGIKNQSTAILWEPFSATQSVAAGTPFTVSSNRVVIPGHGLEIGDVITVAQHNYYVSQIVDANSINLHVHPKTPLHQEPYARGVRIKLMGPFLADRFQIFGTQEGSVKIQKGAQAAVFPEWWGALAAESGVSRAQSNSVALQKAIWSFYDGGAKHGWSGQIKLASGQYVINDPLVLRPGLHLVGAGAGKNLASGTIIGPRDGSRSKFHLVCDTATPPIKDPVVLRDITLVGSSGNQVHFCYRTMINIHNCYFYGGREAAVWVRGSDAKIVHNQFDAGAEGVYIGFDSLVEGNEIAFIGRDQEREYYYGIVVDGGANIVSNNMVYSDAAAKRKGKTVGIYLPDHTTESNIIKDNRIDNNDYGIIMARSSGIIQNNQIYDCREDAILTALPDILINGGIVLSNTYLVGNKIASYKRGLVLDNGAYLNSGVIKDNIFSSNPSGHMVIGNLTRDYDRGWPLIENNIGVDLNQWQTLALNSQTPSVLMGKRWKSANTRPTTIYRLEQGANGKEILLSLEDPFTELSVWAPENIATLDGIFTYCPDGPGNWSPNLYSTSRWRLFRDNPAINADAIYFGCFRVRFCGIKIYVDQPMDGDPVVGWHYFNGTDWQELGVSPAKPFCSPGWQEISFDAPDNWARVEVNGFKGFWIKASLKQVTGVTTGGIQGDGTNQRVRSAHLRFASGTNKSGPPKRPTSLVLHLVNKNDIWHEVNQN